MTVLISRSHRGTELQKKEFDLEMTRRIKLEFITTLCFLYFCDSVGIFLNILQSEKSPVSTFTKVEIGPLL